ncbi:MAG: SRPBCC domain-containing protein [Actinobacteria bacterium]|nr:MAG: SRPBCC domain-containing protein [Actinomycetota bacterium]
MPAEQSTTDSVIEHEVRVAASPDSVFEYFTDPAKMVQWMGTEATLDPRPGGVCRVSPAGHATVLGEFVEVDRPRRIVFTWGWETALFATPPQSTLVEVSLTPDGEETIVRLAHRRLNHEALAFHRAGWGHYLPRLVLAASGTVPGPDPWRDLDLNLRALRAAGVALAPQ